MPHHGNEAEHSEGNEPRKPVIRDNRKVDLKPGLPATPKAKLLLTPKATPPPRKVTLSPVLRKSSTG